MAQGLPVALSAPVTRVELLGPGVSVETHNGGRLHARVVAVNAPVMTLDEIRCVTELPDGVRRAIEGFLPGLHEHVVLRWPSAPFQGRDRLLSFVGGRLRPLGLLTRVDGAPFHYLELDVPNLRGIDARRDAGGAYTEGLCIAQEVVATPRECA